MTDSPKVLPRSDVIGPGATVCVTGASGFVASWVVKLLLESDQSYRVRGTVRGEPTGEKYAWLRALDEDGRLELFSADLLDDGAFDEAFSGCDAVIHTASPYAVNVKDPQAELVDPALNGTLNVLTSALAVESITRVVVTSSMAAVTDQPENDHVYTEDDWNEKSSLTRNPYYFSKVLAEKAAWSFVEDHSPKFSLTVVNPFVVIGPTVPGFPGTNTSTDIIKDLLTGGFPAIMAFAWSFVDVRDVGKAHLLAMEVPSASGRYICANGAIKMKAVVELFKANGYSAYKLPSTKLSLDCTIGSALVKVGARFEEKGTADYIRTNLNTFPQLSTAKAQSELGMTFLPVDQSLLETAEDLIEKGHVGRRT